MSLAELKQETQSLSPAERAELRAWLKLLDLKENGARQSQLFTKLDQAKAGCVTDEAGLRERMGPRSPG